MGLFAIRAGSSLNATNRCAVLQVTCCVSQKMFQEHLKSQSAHENIVETSCREVGYEVWHTRIGSGTNFLWTIKTSIPIQPSLFNTYLNHIEINYLVSLFSKVGNKTNAVTQFSLCLHQTYTNKTTCEQFLAYIHSTQDRNWGECVSLTWQHLRSRVPARRCSSFLTQTPKTHKTANRTAQGRQLCSSDDKQKDEFFFHANSPTSPMERVLLPYNSNGHSFGQSFGPCRSSPEKPALQLTVL